MGCILECFEFTHLRNDYSLPGTELLPKRFSSFDGDGPSAWFAGKREVIGFGSVRGAQRGAIVGFESAYSGFDVHR